MVNACHKHQILGFVKLVASQKLLTKNQSLTALASVNKITELFLDLCFRLCISI